MEIMTSKKAWIKIFEAVIAVLLITSVLLVVLGTGVVENDGETLKIYNEEISILREIQLDNALREEILNANPPVGLDALPGVEEKILDRTPDYLSCKAMVCAMDDDCILDGYSGKEVYVQSVVITVNIQSESFNPRQLKLFCEKI